ncbi:RNA polymerase sigma-70 factor [Paludibaculum fermentans]|uniref:RNA polymerase sigma-70 factor n=1 Tax=Paludibaculum fermentans TaxID=1473598 RepID=UPI003EB90B9B
MHPASDFEQHRSALFGLAYRMLGSAHEAEDIVQEAYLRYAAETAPILSLKPYLMTIVARLCLDTMKSARVRREEYTGPWLPEPVLTTTPADSVIEAESLSFAFLVVLETLSPVERAVFLLREVFDYDYSAIANMLETTEANCRQLLKRARSHIDARRPRFPIPEQRHQALLSSFTRACLDGDLHAISALLVQDAKMYSDSGGKVRAPLNPLYGADVIGRFFAGVKQKPQPEITFRIGTVNGQPAVVGYIDGKLAYVTQVKLEGDLISEIYVIANPDKLPLP